MDKVLKDVIKEIIETRAMWGTRHSAHEAYAILSEEVDELWEHVKTKPHMRKYDAMRIECVQVAAMAIRFAIECCEEDGPAYGK